MGHRVSYCRVWRKEKLMGEKLMRSVEERMVAAILDNKSLKLGTTKVVRENNCSKVYFYGSNIAIINEKTVLINNCGCLTQTTKSRINAILSKFTDRQIYQKNHAWYLSGEPLDGFNCDLPNNEWVEIKNTFKLNTFIN